MSHELDKIKKIKKNVLRRYEWNDTKGNMLVNSFNSLSTIAKRLKENDEMAFLAFMSLLKDKIELQEECKERGNRLHRLSKLEARIRKSANKEPQET